MLVRLLAAADSDLRTRLEDYDDHDDVLDVLNDRMSEDQRAAHAAAQDEFIGSLRAAQRTRRDSA